MAAESLIGYKSEEKQSFIIGNLVISALMGLLMFATLVYDSYGTIKSFESYTSKSKIAEHIVGGCVFLVAVGVSFLGWVCSFDSSIFIFIIFIHVHVLFPGCYLLGGCCTSTPSDP